MDWSIGKFNWTTKPIPLGKKWDNNNCKNCIFLGQFNMEGMVLDLYHCQNNKVFVSYNHDGQYCSSAWYANPTGPDMIEAKRLAKLQGLI